MVTVGCDDPTLGLASVPCGAVPSRLYLSRPFHPTVELTLTGATITGFEETPRDGVWTLHAETDCGCYYLPVHIQLCAPPALPHASDPPQSDSSVECCPDEP